MKNLLKKAQDYLDSEAEVPQILVKRMSREERELLNNITLFQKRLEMELDLSVSGKGFVLNKAIEEEMEEEGRQENKFLRNVSILAGAAAFLFVTGIPVYRSMEANRLIKQETKDFVASITDTDWTSSILSEDTFSSDWFDPEDQAAAELF